MRLMRKVGLGSNGAEPVGLGSNVAEPENSMELRGSRLVRC